MIRIETQGIGKNGLQSIKGFIDDYEVISLRDGLLDSEGKGVWKVTCSSCMPSDIEHAKLMHECMSQAFSKLDDIIDYPEEDNYFVEMRERDSKVKFDNENDVLTEYNEDEFIIIDCNNITNNEEV